ncbi:MAG: ABC-F family ATP-binding cassette domain-containing protein [Defluviitaleaceae bacterium]|nr:ABC-F family ATP-binding cassette domain-containing protein [Defluviitaleaceae bacterium]
MILSASGISKSFGADLIIENISFHINNGDKLGIVGVNGAGKTTLLKIITGELTADTGNISIPSGISSGYIAQLSSLNEQNTLEDELLSVFAHIQALEEKLSLLSHKISESSEDELNLYMTEYEKADFEFEKNNGYEYRSRVRGVIAGLGFAGEADKPISIMSGGQKTRVALGKLLLTSPDLLLLDEPTNHLDISSIKWLEDFIKNYPKSVVVISHDRYFLDKTINKVLEIENKHASMFSGNYSFYANEKGILRQHALKHYLDQQKVIKKQEDAARLLRSYGNEKKVRRAQSKEKQLEKMEKFEKPENLPDKIRINLTPKIESGNDVMFIDNLAKSFGDNRLFSGLSMEIKKGDKTALIGPNGIGKTTLFRIITGEHEGDTGEIKLGHKVKVGYYDQSLKDLSPDKTIVEEISDAYPKLNIGEIRNILSAFVFYGDDVYKKIGSLSGGEKGRVSLAKIMLSDANFLLLDEPTNHLDIVSKEILEDALRGFGGTILFISHDRYFINSIATKIFEMDGYNLAAYLGDYDYYVHKKEQLEKNEMQMNALSSAAEIEVKSDWQLKKEKEAALRKQKNRKKRLESDIVGAEALIEKLSTQLEDPSIASDYERTAELYKEREEAEGRLLVLYEEYEKCEDTS